MKARVEIRAGLKYLLKSVVKLAGWKVWLILIVYDCLWRMFVPSFLLSLKAQKNRKKKEDATRALFLRMKEKSTAQDFTENMKELWEGRKRES